MKKNQKELFCSMFQLLYGIIGIALILFVVVDNSSRVVEMSASLSFAVGFLLLGVQGLMDYN